MPPSLFAATHPSLTIAVASGDSDMQQLLSPRVSWLSVKSAPSLQHPLGVELVAAADFEQQHGFPPQAYPDFLAFVGAWWGRVILERGWIGCSREAAAPPLGREVQACRCAIDSQC